PVLIGLLVIWLVFYAASGGTFFSPFNLVNLALQMAAVGTIAVGVVFVLLLGEIDLTVGIVSGLCAGVMAVLNVKMGLPGPVAVVAYLAGASDLVRSRRLTAGLGAESMSTLAVRSVVIAAFVAGGILALGQDRGVPLSLAFLVGLVVLMDHVAKRTRFGRMVFAVGGSREAARRAGIPVSAVRVAVFALASTCAAWGGVLAASRLLAVNQSAGSGDVL